MNNMSNNNNNIGQFGDTTLTKVFVGGLAWETPKEAMRDHFEKFGEILEAVIISDKVTGRSKGYGFVTFKEPESAKKACEDPNPIINGRRANCNLASLGARRPRSSSATSTTTPPQQGSNVGPRSTSSAPANHLQWYYPAGTPATPFHHQHHHNHQAVPFYGYPPTYIATDVSYSHKLSYTGGSYVNGHFSQVYPGQPIVRANIDANVPSLSLPSIADNGPTCPHLPTNHCGSHHHGPRYHLQTSINCPEPSLLGCGILGTGGGGDQDLKKVE